MSRCYSAILGCAWLWVGSFSSSAATFGDFDYEVLEDNTIEIIDYNGSDAEVVIPDTIEGLPVTSIGGRAFYLSGLTSVTIPNSVTSIGDWAFTSCWGLTSVTIGDSVTNIGNGAFDGCSGLNSVTIPDSVTSIGDSAFSGCSGLTSVTIPDSVTSIGDGAFAGCTSLSAIEVNELNPAYSSVHGVLLDKNQTTVTQFPAGYEGHYEIPASVTSIGDGAFYGCSGLTSVTIGASVTSIGEQAFGDCGSLTTIEVNELNECYSSIDGVLFNKNQATVLLCPGGYEGHFDIPPMVTFIGDSAFSSCYSLTSVTIPNSVTSIGDSAFYECIGLTSVTIPDSVTSIGDSAFSWCPSLTSVTIGASVTSIGKRAFSYCFGLTSVTIGTSVTSIGDEAFYYCDGLSGLTIPDGVISIGSYLCWGCSGLTCVTIGSNVTNIGKYAFARCEYLIEVYFKGNPPSVGFFPIFEGSFPTIYYLESTTGWGETFAGRPTAVWYLDEPEVFFDQMTLDSAGVCLWVVGPAGRTVSVQACTDVAAGEWGELGTYSLDESGAYAFTDPAWADFPSRFYWAVLIE
ncbi:MAG: leucine-rich repeat protein [Verrucomicrobiota bacterium]|jgi:hypothetical protein